MSETPETYAVWLEVAKIDVKHVPRVLRDHAEKMERERNEAREVAERQRPPTRRRQHLTLLNYERYPIEP